MIGACLGSAHLSARLRSWLLLTVAPGGYSRSNDVDVTIRPGQRTETTVRTLDAMQANLSRLQDLTTEVRRQLAPLRTRAPKNKRG